MGPTINDITIHARNGDFLNKNSQWTSYGKSLQESRGSFNIQNECLKKSWESVLSAMKEGKASTIASEMAGKDIKLILKEHPELATVKEVVEQCKREALNTDEGWPKLNLGPDNEATVEIEDVNIEEVDKEEI